MFGWEFPPHITGGLGTACYGLTKGLLTHGAEVLFVVPKTFGDEDQSVARIVNASDVKLSFTEENKNEYWKRLTYIEINSTMIPYVSPEEFKKVRGNDVLDHTDYIKNIFSEEFKFSGKYGPDLMQEVARYALVGAKIASENDFDIIHAHDWLTYSAGVAAKEISGKPLVVHLHATEFDRSGEHVNQDVYGIERMGLNAADMVIAVSNLTRQIAIDKYGVDPSKIVTVYNAVEPSEDERTVYQRHVKEKVVTFLGRVTFQKGPDYFIEAANKVLKKDPNVRFVMAGSGDMLNKMIKRVAQLGISTKFHFTGFLKGEEVNHMFSISDVYVMPSVSEPFGISPLEAMRSNVPVIISRQSGVAEVLNYAIKINFWDIDAMADSIYGLIHYPAISRMFIKHGKVEVDNLKWENAAFEVYKIYSKMLNR